LISSSIKIHDKFQCEIDLFFKPPRKKRNQGYKIDTFIFVPKTLDINELTYDKNDFYKGIKNYIRLKAPELLFKNFTNYAEYLEKISQDIIKFEAGEITIQNFEHDLHVFCCSLENAVTKRVEITITNHNYDKDAHHLKSLIHSTRKILTKFRELKEFHQSNHEIYETLKLIDEYISFFIKRNLFKLLNYLGHNLECNTSETRNELLKLIKEEIKYCQINSILLPAKNQSNEEYVYRNKVLLKKLVWSSLYLNVDTTRGHKWVSHTIFAIAAGISMVFATLVAFVVQQTYGNVSFPFFMALVIGYMGKDRIKEILRDVFKDKLDSITAERVTKVFSKEWTRIGTIKERFNYVHDSNIDPNVLRLRYVGSSPIFKRLKKNEEIIKYQKKVLFKGKKFWSIYSKSNTDGVKDILRINIAPFIQKMDSPYTYDSVLEDDRAISVRLERFYKLNIVIKYTSISDTHYHKYRIVFNRKGINRIDAVNNSKQ